MAEPATLDPRRSTLARVAVLFYRIGPYHYARLRAAGTVADVTAIEFSNVDPTYAWDEVKGEEGFQRVTLYRDVSVESQSAAEIFRRMAEVLDQVQPDVVVVAGWHDRCSLAALRWALKGSVPVVLMSETTAWDEKRRWWKEAIKRSIVSLCGAALVGGRAHRDYLAQLGMSPERIFLGYDAVDNAFFNQKADAMRDDVAGNDDLRKKHGLPKKYFLASARFVEKKNLLRLLEAYSEYLKLCEGQFEVQSSKFNVQGSSSSLAPSTSPWSLVLLGDGPLRDKIQLRVSTLGLRGQVHLPGFKQYPDLPMYYALASAFVHASTVEQWGLVVNEAMASGLPVLLSDHCGCTADLLEEGRNGFRFDPYDSGMLAGRMSELSRMGEDQLNFCGAASKEIISRWGPEAFAKGLHQAVEAAREAGPARLTGRREALLIGLTWALRGASEKGLRPRPFRKKADPQEADGKPPGIEPIYIRLRFRGRNVLTMPHEPRALHRPALARYQPFTSKRRAYRGLMNAAIRLKRPEWVGTLSATPVPLEEGFDYQGWLAEMRVRLGRELYGVVTWPSEPNRRRLYVHLFGQDLKAVAFAKILLSSDDARYFEGAASTYAELGAKSFTRVRVPRLLARDRFAQARFLLFEALPEEARPLRLQRSADAREIIREYAGEPTRLSSEQVIATDWWTQYATRLSRKAMAFHTELTHLLSEGARVRRAHGDFGLSNVVAADSFWWIFDWEMSHPHAPVLTDEVGFFMSFSVGKAPRSPSRYLGRLREQFLKGAGKERRMDVMLALAFRHAAGIPDASAFICNWPT
ncbi:MAG: hypothetical protein C5B50_28215 [Verrucomicrobia bacterium]|nr:MAG: hypothetical protein C5B50_28215 [Verrucomicrobiota bacterium]